MREKLIELLKNSFDEQYSKRGFLTAPHTAEHLIANGVTVQEWIPVTERLPEEHGLYLIATNGKVETAYRQSFLMFGLIWNNDMTGGFSIIPEDEVTHWMTLPEPPKGE